MKVYDEKGAYQASVPLGSPSNGGIDVTVGENDQKLLTAVDIKNEQCASPAPIDDPLPMLHFVKINEEIKTTDEEKQSFLKSNKQSVDGIVDGFRMPRNGFDINEGLEPHGEQEQIRSQHQPQPTQLPSLNIPSLDVILPEQRELNETVEQSKELAQTSPDELRQQESQNSSTSPIPLMDMPEDTAKNYRLKPPSADEKAHDFKQLLQHDSVVNLCNVLSCRPSIMGSSATALRQALLLQGQNQPKRYFIGWMTKDSFNSLDEDRLKEVGPDRVAAEWILRCGGGIRFSHRPHLITDYNMLPPEKDHPTLVGIDATDSTVTGPGFHAHFKLLKGLKELKLANNKYLKDDALANLPLVKNSLETLNIEHCSHFSESELMRNVKELTNLKSLHLFDLSSVSNREQVVSELKKALPKCDVQFPASK
uniref:ATP synthase subunit s, mitochondrial n=1 Tax=Plectus sambesii TaxID=2011161 RepID=A0A914WJY9_9BILA